ncbi:hypothetical protein HLH17_14590 [Acinetobacter sp. ANC 5380]|uniref:Lipoprotein n=1 Tax=Acinetobacter terrae TaxID=2731247 RepID=A0A7Y2RHZ5_9GAMM|nr:hypothetical protein [Acinetobacter terrae]NNH78849.1 hypothetical protein [Acinetobacter terrae]
MKKVFFATLLAMTILGGCGKNPYDEPLSFQSKELMSESASKIRAGLNAEEIQIFDWALENIDLNTFNTAEKLKEYLGESTSFRKLAVRAINDRKQPVFDESARLKSIESDWFEAHAQLSKINASDVRLSTSHEFMTRGYPVVSFNVHNASKFNISQLTWQAHLFLDGDKEPYVSSVVIDSYTHGSKSNGLKENEKVRRSLVVDQFTALIDPDVKKWTDLKAQNAKSKRVEITLIPTSSKDFSDQYFISDNVPESIKRYEMEKGLIERAEKLVL